MELDSDGGGGEYLSNVIVRSHFSTHPFLKGEVGGGAPGVLVGQQPVGVPGTGRLGVRGCVGAGGAHGRRHVAVVVQRGAVAGVRRCRLRGGRVGPTQQRRGSPIHRFVGPGGQTSWCDTIRT